MESAAKTLFLLLKCSMSCAEPLPGFSSGLQGIEYAFGGDFGISELRGAMGCCMIIGKSSWCLLVFGWVKFIKPSPLTHAL